MRLDDPAAAGLPDPVGSGIFVLPAEIASATYIPGMEKASTDKKVPDLVETGEISLRASSSLSKWLLA